MNPSKTAKGTPSPKKSSVREARVPSAPPSARPRLQSQIDVERGDWEGMGQSQFQTEPEPVPAPDTASKKSTEGDAPRPHGT